MSAVLNQPLNFVRNQFHDRLVQVSVYSGLVFYVLSNPAVFAFVEKNFPFSVQERYAVSLPHSSLYALYVFRN